MSSSALRTVKITRVNLHPAAAKLPTHYDAAWDGKIVLPLNEHLSTTSTIKRQLVDPAQDPSRKQLAFWMGHALASIHPNALTLLNSLRVLSYFFSFLDRRSFRLKNTHDITNQHLQIYLNDLRDGKSLYRNEARKITIVTHALRILRQADKSLVQPDLNTSLRLTTRVRRSSPNSLTTTTFSLKDKARLEKVLRAEMHSTLRRMELADKHIQRAISKGVDQADPTIDLNRKANLGEILAKFRYQLCWNRAPAHRAFNKKLGHIWQRAHWRTAALFDGIYKVKGLECSEQRELRELALPSSRTLIPFYLWVACRAPINTAPLCCLHTDCLNFSPRTGSQRRQDELDSALRADADIEYLRLFKGRGQRIGRTRNAAKEWHFEPFLRGVESSPIATIKTILEVTKYARASAPANLRHYARTEGALKLRTLGCGGRSLDQNNSRGNSAKAGSRSAREGKTVGTRPIH